MLPILSREQMQAFDHFASERWRVPAAVLMENAGRGATEVIAPRLGGPATQVVVVTGAGNNAGDGFVVARRLMVLGHKVKVLGLCSPHFLSGIARDNCEAFVALGGSLLDCSQAGQALQLEKNLQSADCIVDAILGTGLSRDVEGVFSEAINAVNRLHSSGSRRHWVVSLDIPSGLHANSGRIMGVAVKAQLTVSFAAHKLGTLTSNGADHCGEIHIVDIGVPARVDAQEGCSAWLVEAADVSAMFSARRRSAHKNSAGRVVVFAGSPGKVGAALIVGQAALRCGAGVVTLAGFDEAAALLDRRVVELMTVRIDHDSIERSVEQICQSADAVVIGPGLGLDDAAKAVVRAVVSGFAGPKVVDADALTHFSGNAGELKGAQGSLVLTPHPGEMGRLLGLTTAQVEADRLAATLQAAKLTGGTVLLKGPCTIIATPGEQTIIHQANAPALATAGSGDVLSGIVGAFCLGMTSHQAATAGVFVHARAAEAWQAANNAADRGLLAHEVSDHAPGIIAELSHLAAALTD